MSTNICCWTNQNHLSFWMSFCIYILCYRPDQKKDDIGLLRTMAAGSVGGVCLWTAIFPADVIKSRVQISNIKTNMFVMGLNIARTEGISALYNGLKPTIIRTIPATAVLFVVYEYSKKFMSQIFWTKHFQFSMGNKTVMLAYFKMNQFLFSSSFLFTLLCSSSSTLSASHLRGIVRERWRKWAFSAEMRINAGSRAKILQTLV